MHLYGFLNPAGRYPALVISIWIDESKKLHGCFDADSESDDEMSNLEQLDDIDSVVRLPNGWTDQSIRGLDPRNVGLVALNITSIIGYDRRHEAVVISELLQDPSFASDQPFSRMAFARASGSYALIATEFMAVSNYLLSQEVIHSNGVGQTRLEKWLSLERDIISDQLYGCADVTEFVANLPTSLSELSKNIWWRGYVSGPKPTKLYSLLEIEDQRPSPLQVMVLNNEPKVPDKEMLAVMGRHLIAGTRYLFLHAPSASTESFQKLKAATDLAVDKAAQTGRGPMAVMSPNSVGSVTFYRLDHDWTGSPYVFYQVPADNEAPIIGFRGKDIGASISRYYERIPDYLASELVEALVSNKPGLFDVENSSTVASIQDAKVKRKMEQ